MYVACIVIVVGRCDGGGGGNVNGGIDKLKNNYAKIFVYK